jgi:hypothetical protein
LIDIPWGADRLDIERLRVTAALWGAGLVAVVWALWPEGRETPAEDARYDEEDLF